MSVFHQLAASYTSSKILAINYWYLLVILTLLYAYWWKGNRKRGR